MEKKITGRFFIVGCPRSGTTLLQSLLAAHPQIASYPETHFFWYVAKDRWRKHLGIASPDVKRRLYQFLSDIGHTEMKDFVSKYGLFIWQYTNAFVRILDTLTINQGKEIWVEKTPIHLHFIEMIEKYVKGAKFIHMLRKGEDVVASLYEVTQKYPKEWGGQRTIEKCVNRWNRDIKITQYYSNKKNHSLVRYEELVKNPEDVLRRTCEFIGVEFTQNMITQHSIVAEKVILDNQEWIKSAKREIHNANGKKFRKLFNQKQQAWIINHLEKII